MTSYAVPVYQLRPASDDDFAFMQEVKFDGLQPHITALWGWNRRVQEKSFRDTFDAGRCQIVVVDGVDAGYLDLVHERDGVFLRGIYLSSGMRGKGIGTAVIRDVIREAHSRGGSVELQVLTSNPARALYERLGFVAGSQTATHLRMRFGARAELTIPRAGQP